MPQAVWGPETHSIKMNFLTTFCVAKKVKISPKGVRLDEFLKIQRRKFST